MTIRKANPETHQTCRSLLQKAVRRGCITLIPKVINHLVNVGDMDWLKNRVNVITFEECWPLGIQLDSKLEVEEISRTLTEVAISVKQKDAAGLGAMAYELSKGDTTVISDPIADHSIQIISEAIKRPNEFWLWVENESSVDQKRLIEKAHSAFKHGGWPWDRAFMQAAALLAVTNGIPIVTNSYKFEQREIEFPFWIAIDKHTREGKEIIKLAAEKTGQNARIISWLFFYFASSVENEMAPSYWWKRENEWRLHKLGFSLSEAENAWRKIYPIIQDLLREKEENLKIHILSGHEIDQTPKQLSLF